MSIFPLKCSTCVISELSFSGSLKSIRSRFNYKSIITSISNDSLLPCFNEGGLPKKLDLIFLVDGSKSVKQGPFLKGLEFVNKIVDHVNISKDKGRVGFVSFSHKVL